MSRERECSEKFGCVAIYSAAWLSVKKINVVAVAHKLKNIIGEFSCCITVR